jgi:hypothetical protein
VGCDGSRTRLASGWRSKSSRTQAHEAWLVRVVLYRLVRSRADPIAGALRRVVPSTRLDGSTALSSAQNSQHQNTIQFGNESDSRARMTLHRISLLAVPMYEAPDSVPTVKHDRCAQGKEPSLGEAGPSALHETPSANNGSNGEKSSTSGLFPATVSLPRAFTGLSHHMHRANQQRRPSGCIEPMTYQWRSWAKKLALPQFVDPPANRLRTPHSEWRHNGGMVNYERLATQNATLALES